MLNKYRNEAIIVVSAILLLIAILYSSSMYALYSSKSDEVGSQLSKIKDISVMQKLWKDKNIPKKLENIKAEVEASKIVKFDIQGNKAHIVINDLSGNELNKIVTNDIAKIAVQIVDLSINRSEDKYKLEAHCIW